MRIDILTEPSFADSSWCKAISYGLLKTLTRKKIAYQTVFDVPTSDISSPDHFLILIASNEAWITEAICRCREQKIHPVLLSAAPRHPMSGIYSTVISDIRQSMYYLLYYLKKQGRTELPQFVRTVQKSALW